MDLLSFILLHFFFPFFKSNARHLSFTIKIPDNSVELNFRSLHFHHYYKFVHLRMKFLEKKITFLYVLSAFCYRFAFLWFFFEYTYCSVVVTQDSFSLSVVYCECVWHCFAYLLHLSLHKHNVLSVCLPSSFVRIRHKQTVHLSKQIGSTQNELHPKWLNAVKCNEKKTNEKYFYIEKYKIYYCIRSFSCASASDNMNAGKTKKNIF